MDTIREPAKNIPVVQDVDIVVLGGGCTGVFAAIRAARLGAKVAIVEQCNAFGGTATNGFVCIWHTLTDTTFKRQIISGLTEELIDRLRRVPNGIDVVPPPEGDNVPFRGRNYHNYHLNTEEMKIELDQMILEAGVTPYLHTRYAAPYLEDGVLKAVIIENRSGRQAIRAKFFIDATADGYLGADVGMETYYHDEHVQPATMGARVWGWNNLTDPNTRLRTEESRLRIGGRAGWDDMVPGADNVCSWFKSQFPGDCSQADQMTAGEISGRRAVREMMNILREQDPHGKDLSLVALASLLGIRETRQLKCSYQVTTEDILYGKQFDDAIAYCAYPSDVHTPQHISIFRYLDGGMRRGNSQGEVEYVRWRTDDGPYPTYWQLPYRCLLPQKIGNLLICGRAIDTDKGAFGAARVMICLNQTGEACGVASYEALNGNKTVQQVDPAALRRRMQAGGSIML